MKSTKKLAREYDDNVWKIEELERQGIDYNPDDFEIDINDEKYTRQIYDDSQFVEENYDDTYTSQYQHFE